MREIVNSCQEKGNVVPESTKASVALGTQEPTNLVGSMAVVNVKTGGSSVAVDSLLFADGADSFLGLENSLKLLHGDSILSDVVLLGRKSRKSFYLSLKRILRNLHSWDDRVVFPRFRILLASRLVSDQGVIAVLDTAIPAGLRTHLLGLLMTSLGMPILLEVPFSLQRWNLSRLHFLQAVLKPSALSTALENS